MTRRWPDMARPLPRPMTWIDWFLVCLLSFIVCGLYAMFFGLMILTGHR